MPKVVQPSHVQLLTLNLFLHYYGCCGKCTLWLLGLLLHLHVLLEHCLQYLLLLLLQCRLLHNSLQLRRFHCIVTLSEHQATLP